MFTTIFFEIIDFFKLKILKKYSTGLSSQESYKLILRPFRTSNSRCYPLPAYSVGMHTPIIASNTGYHAEVWEPENTVGSYRFFNSVLFLSV